MNEWTNGPTDGWINERMEGDGRMHGRTPRRDTKEGHKESWLSIGGGGSWVEGGAGTCPRVEARLLEARLSKGHKESWLSIGRGGYGSCEAPEHGLLWQHSSGASERLVVV